MRISGFQKRSIYTQTGNFSFLYSVASDSLSGDFELGFSGDNTSIPIFFKNGRIIDHNQNHLSSYSRNAPTKISGDVSVNSVDYYLNDKPIAFGSPRTTGNLDYFYIKPHLCNLDLQLSIKGNKPSYEVTDNIIFLTGEPILTGTITNYSAPFRIFSGKYNGDTNLSNISGLPFNVPEGTSNFYIINKGVRGNTTFPFTLYTNFGVKDVIVSGSGITETNNLYSMSVTAMNDPSPLNGYNSNFYTTFSNPTGNIELDVALRVLAGTGEIYSNQITTGFYSDYVTGFVVESGVLSKTITTLTSGVDYLGQIFTGETSFLVTSTVFATGIQTSFATFIGTGIGYNDEYSGPATGIVSGTITGIIESGSGSINVYGLQFGTTSYCQSIATGYGAATGYVGFINEPSSGDTFSINNNGVIFGTDYTGIYSMADFINSNTGIYLVEAITSGSGMFLTALVEGLDGNYIELSTIQDPNNSIYISSNSLQGGYNLGTGVPLTGFGQFSGIIDSITLTGSGNYSIPVSGFANGLQNALSYVKILSNTWNLKTGINSFKTTSYRDMDYINNIKDTYTGPSAIRNRGSFYAYVEYSTPFPSGDFAELTITGVGLGTGFNIQISGRNQ